MLHSFWLFLHCLLWKIQKLLNSLQWPIYFINSNDNTKLPSYTLPPTQHHSFFRNLPLCSTDLHNCFQYLISCRSMPLIDQFCYLNLTLWVRVISYLSYLSSNSFWKEEVLKTYQQNAAIYHHLPGWNEKKCYFAKTQITCQIKN